MVAPAEAQALWLQLGSPPPHFPAGPTAGGHVSQPPRTGVCFSHDLNKMGYVLERLPRACPRLGLVVLEHDKGEVPAVKGFDRYKEELGVVVGYRFHGRAFGLSNVLLKFQAEHPGIRVRFEAPPLEQEVIDDC